MTFTLQSEIMSKPELFVEPDPELPLALLDQKEVRFQSSHKCLIAMVSVVNIVLFAHRLVKSSCLSQTQIITTQTK